MSLITCKLSSSQLYCSTLAKLLLIETNSTLCVNIFYLHSAGEHGLCIVESPLSRSMVVPLEISIFWVITVCEIQSASYESKHALQPLSGTTFCVYLHSQLKKYRLSNDCSTIGDVYFLCWSWMRDTTDELWLQPRIAISF